jgi:hypothetical protein
MEIIPSSIINRSNSREKEEIIREKRKKQRRANFLCFKDVDWVSVKDLHQYCGG